MLLVHDNFYLSYLLQFISQYHHLFLPSTCSLFITDSSDKFYLSYLLQFTSQYRKRKHWGSIHYSWGSHKTKSQNNIKLKWSFARSRLDTSWFRLHSRCGCGNRRDSGFCFYFSLIHWFYEANKILWLYGRAIINAFISIQSFIIFYHLF